METTATLFIRNRNDNIGLDFKNSITAWMEDAVYNSTNVFTENDVIVARCNCHTWQGKGS